MVKNTSFLHSEDVEIDNDYYDIVIVDGWQEEMDEDWDGQGEVIAEICLDPPNFDPIPRKEIVQRPATPQDDCANLSWLLNFKLDGLIGLNQNTEETVKGSVAAEKKTSDEEHPVKKPPYTYTELIELALKEKGQLTVSQIYRWIS